MTDEKLPLRTELTVLPADDPNQRTIGWVVREYNGTEVFKADAHGTALKNESDIQVGDKLHVQTLVGTYVMIATRDEYGVLFAQTEPGGMFADLQFNKDDRHCWASTYAVNAKAIKKTSVTRDP
jgi:hypothetical protein